MTKHSRKEEKRRKIKGKFKTEGGEKDAAKSRAEQRLEKRRVEGIKYRED